MRDLLARGTTAVTLAGVAVSGSVSACATPSYRPAAPVAFDSAAVWIVQDSDSARLSVEVAESRREQEVGLSGRASLPRDRGMLFTFAEERSGEDGFWMVGTEIPLDIAFIDDGGVIRKIMRMDVCEEPDGVDACPGYFPRVPYRSALEVNRGWFEEHRVRVGARVHIVG